MNLLRALGFDVQLSLAGCCGMAGTFGYDAEHYDLSMQIGEMKLFPQARSAGDAAIVSTGASCRIHLRQALAVEIHHPIEVIARQWI